MIDNHATLACAPKTIRPSQNLRRRSVLAQIVVLANLYAAYQDFCPIIHLAEGRWHWLSALQSGPYFLYLFVLTESATTFSGFKKNLSGLAGLVRMLTQRAKRIPEKDWLTHQQTLKRLWLEEKREMLGEEGVVETMRARHDFSAS